jgi:hypothetical protein
MDRSCPVCGKDDASQKVSALFSGGVQSVGLETFSQSARGVTISRQAMRMAPPAKPKEPSGLHWLLWIVGLILGVVFLGGVLAIAGMSLTSGGDAGILGGFLYGSACGYPLGFVLTIAGLVVLHGALIKGSRARFSREMPPWQAKMERWERLYYCSRDDVVFDPTDGKSVMPEDLQSLLVTAAAIT